MIADLLWNLRDRKFRDLTYRMGLHDDEVEEMIEANYASHAYVFEGRTYVVFLADGQKEARRLHPWGARFFVREFTRRQRASRWQGDPETPAAGHEG